MKMYLVPPFRYDWGCKHILDNRSGVFFGDETMNEQTRRQLMRQRFYREFHAQPDCRARVERELGLLQLFGFRLPVGWQFPTEKRRLWLNWRYAFLGRRN